jgi:hypothetical protein
MKGQKMIMILLLMSIWCSSLSGGESKAVRDWTCLYRKNFVKNGCVNNNNKKVLFFMEENVTPFTQLVFSWNALRPEEGYFSFFVQVRDAVTKKWGLWHHMVDWGNNIQQSYISKSDGFSSYIYVRLETDDKKGADAFRIKIEPHKAAS